MAAWERQHPEEAAQPLGKRRRADGRSGIERAVERRASQESAPSPAEQQRSEAAARDAELDRKYAENPMRYDAAREFLRGCHQTPQHGSIACHWDACNPGLESVHGVLTGHPASIQPLALAPCGSLQRPPRSALVFPLQGVATLAGCTCGAWVLAMAQSYATTRTWRRARRSGTSTTSSTGR